MSIALNSKSDPATLGSDPYPPVAGRNSKQTCPEQSRRIQNSNYQNAKRPSLPDGRFCPDSSGFVFWTFDIVSDFGFRASDFSSKTGFSILHCAVVLIINNLLSLANVRVDSIFVT